jgi:hypothetical protein
LIRLNSVNKLRNFIGSCGSPAGDFKYGWNLI